MFLLSLLIYYIYEVIHNIEEREEEKIMKEETMKGIISKSVKNCDNAMSLDMFNERTEELSQSGPSARTAPKPARSKLCTALHSKRLRRHSELRSEFKEIVTDIAKSTNNVVSFKELENL